MDLVQWVYMPIMIYVNSKITGCLFLLIFYNWLIGCISHTWQWNLAELSSLDMPEIVQMTTSGAGCNDNFIEMTTLQV